MQAISILICSIIISSATWIVPLLLLGRHKMIEEVQDQDLEIDVTADYNFIKDCIYEDEVACEIEEQAGYTCDIDDEMVMVAATRKISSRIVSKDFSFSIN